MPQGRARASAAIVQRVPTECEDAFLEWQRSVAEVASRFAGYVGTDTYPPRSVGAAWVTVLHFDDEPALDRWLDSEERAHWVAKLRTQVGDFELTKLRGGFGPWFASVSQQDEGPAPWKMALTVLLGLYPTVMLLSIFVAPYTSPLGFAMSMLIGNALSVALLQWAVVPALSRVLRRWLEATGRSGILLSLVGAAGIVAVLLAMAALFQRFTGQG